MKSRRYNTKNRRRGGDWMNSFITDNNKKTEAVNFQNCAKTTDDKCWDTFLCTDYPGYKNSLLGKKPNVVYPEGSEECKNVNKYFRGKEPSDKILKIPTKSEIASAKSRPKVAGRTRRRGHRK